MSPELGEHTRAMRRVGPQVARYQARNTLPVKDVSGRHPIVLTLSNETMATLAYRLEGYSAANLIVAYDDHWTLLAYEQGKFDGTAESLLQVHPDSEVDMLVQALKINAQSTLSVTVTKPSSTLRELEYSF